MAQHTLSEAHRLTLEVESGIAPGIIETRGYYTATTKTELERIGFGSVQQSVPALVIPMFGVDGEVVAYQCKPDSPRNKNGKWIKYESPHGTNVHLDVHPSQRENLNDPLEPLWITEGVKKGDAAASRGLCCVALQGVWCWKGTNEKAGKAELPDWDRIAFKGRLIYIAFDSDAVTKRDVQDAMRSLGRMVERRGGRPRYVFIPSQGRKVGIDDFFVQGGTVEDLVAAARDEMPYIAPAEVVSEKKTYPMTELGNAERFVDEHGADIRYCASLHRWLTWTGTRWLVGEAESEAVYTMASETVRRMGREAFLVPDEAERKAQVAWALKSENARPLREMLGLARVLPGIPVSIDDLDRGEHLLNVANGTIDLRTGDMRPHDRADLLSRIIDTPYEADAKCDRWCEFLATTFQNDEALMRYVWKAAGYSLTGETREKCFFYLHGAGGDNGKSVFIETLSAILGAYASSTPTSTLLAKVGEGGIPNDLARLKGVRFVAASEVSDGKRLDEELIKQLTGGDTITARFMRAEWFDFKPAFKIWMTGNSLPQIRDQGKPMWRRVKVIPFNHSVPKDQQDITLPEKLQAEYPGILGWMIDGCMAWRRERLGDVASIAGAVESYREEMDDIGDFLAQCTEAGSGLSCSAIKLYGVYENWAKKQGMKAMSNTYFGRKLTARGIDKRKNMYGANYIGLRLLDDETIERVYRGGE